MATRTISTRLVLEGEAEYRAQLKNVNAELALQRSELEKVESQYRNSANSMAALTAKGEALQSMYDAQQAKLNLYISRVEAARKAEESYAKAMETARGRLAEYQARLAELQKAAGNTAEVQAKLKEQIKAESEALEKAEDLQQKAANSAAYYQRQVNQTQVSLDDLNEELAQNRRYLAEAEEAADGCAQSIDRYGRSAEQTRSAVDALAAALVATGAAAGLREIAEAIWSCVEASTEFESAVTGVYKTVEGTPEQLAAISDGIKEMSTQLPATTTEISAVAEAAGQLGIAVDDVLSFTRVMLDLGESTNLTAEEAATALARFANITGTSAADYERLGSVIVALGNNFATTEAEITEMATRLASAGSLAGLTESEILALAAAMSSVGIEAEAGGTAMTQTLAAMEKAVSTGGDSLEQFAEVSGLSAAAFAEAWEGSPITAIQAFISGLDSLEEKGESAVLVLDEMGLSGVRQSNMLQSLALASDQMTGAVSLAGQAWRENTALAEEAGKRYETTESKMAMAANAANNLKVAIGDALNPALGELAETGTDAFTWAADFVEENPWLVQALTGAAGAVGLLAAGITAYAAVATAAKVVQDALNLSMSLCPAVAIAAAIGALVVTIGSFIASADDSTVSVKELTQAAEEMQETMESASASYEETASNTLATAEAAQAYLDKLEELESRQAMTAEQAQEYSNTVALLVNLMPELSQYVQESADGFGRVTFSLTESISALRDYVDAYEQAAMQAAQAEVLEQYRTAYNAAYTEMYANQVELAKITATVSELEERRLEVNERISQLQSQESTTPEERAELDRLYQTISALNEELGEAYKQQETYAQAVESSTPLLEEARQELNETESAMQDLTGATEDNTDAQNENGDSVGESIGTWEDLQSALEDATQSTRTLADAEDTLSSALQEQAENGSLSLDTALDLIDAGYAAALAIDTETGAITINKDAYIAITQAKIQEQIATLEGQKASVNAALAMQDEALMATDLGKAYLNAAQAKSALEGQAKSYETQIAALEALKGSLNSYTFTYTSTVRTTASASRQVKTQAEQDLAAYKELKATLDHEKAMGEVEEKEYYARLARLRDEYLTDDDNLDEYRKITEQIYQYDQKLAEEEQKLWEEHSEAMLSNWEEQLESIQAQTEDTLQEIQSAMEDIEAQRDKMAEKLSSYGDLFTMEKDGDGGEAFSLNSLQEQLDAITAYGETLDKLGGLGLSDSLMERVVGMGVDDATAYGEALLGMTEEELKAYLETWDQIQAESRRISDAFYADELDALQNEYDQQLADALDSINVTVFESGQEWGQLLVDGLSSRESELLNKAAEIARKVQAELSTAYGPTGTAIDGSHAGGLPYVPYDGYIAELHEGERVLTAEEAQAYIARSMPSSYSLPPERTGGIDQNIAAGLVNSIQAVLAGANSTAQPLSVVLKLSNGREIARWLLDDIRAVSKANPEVVSGV
ncbi:phage tail tape measure protein [Flavonifractor plautii]|jgi:TP901 family phage tail tape measure protein|uniref:phage tail tape measure protein n=1 Tax=Flavonifractor plautii TaxID=292800 RepID=UPI00210A7A87|nr:phage tail tape measure protein [Flavonifractor plautii]MCQ5309505.1 phage tail tape measure protein [Flavonifractor plautii]